MSDLSEQVLANFSAEALATAPSRREIYTFIAETSEILSRQVKDLRGLLANIEKSGVRFRGVYQRASTYRRGDQATHKGSLWTALSDVSEGCVPGDDPSRWQLAAKGTG